MIPLTFCPLCHWHDWWTLARLDPLKVVRCGGCGLVALHQQPAPEEIQAYYDEAYFHQEKGGYYRLYSDYLEGKPLPPPYRLFFDRFQKLIEAAKQKSGKGGEATSQAEALRGKAPPRRLLDVGAGMGVFMDMARREGGQVKGVDISPFACRYTKAHFGLDMHCGDLTTLNASWGPFNCITMLDYLEHAPDPVAVLQKARELAALGGLLLISLPRQDSLVDWLALFLNRITGEKFQAPARKIYKREHLFYFNPQTIKKALELCGWELVEMKREESIIPLTQANRLEKFILKIIFALARPLKKENLMLIWAKAKPSPPSPLQP